MRFFLLLFIIPILAWADGDEDLAMAEKIAAENVGRLARYQVIFGQIKDLNYLRMKIMSIQSATDEAVKSWNEISKNCTNEISAEAVEKCHDKLLSLYGTANLRLTQLELLSSSPHYQDLLHNSANDRVQIDNLTRATIPALRKFIEQVQIMRRQLGVRLAEAKLQKILAATNTRSQKSSLEIECRLSPLTLEQKLLGAKLSRQKAGLDVDPYLILRGAEIEKEVDEELSALVSRCAHDNVARLESKVREALASSTHDSADMILLATKACLKLNSHDHEIKAICEKSDFNPTTIYSIHRKILESSAHK